MTIKFGDVEYFELLELRDRLKYFRYDRLDLSGLDRLRSELEFKIEAIHEADKLERQTRDSEAWADKTAKEINEQTK